MLCCCVLLCDDVVVVVVVVAVVVVVVSDASIQQGVSVLRKSWREPAVRWLSLSIAPGIKRPLHFLKEI